MLQSLAITCLVLLESFFMAEAFVGVTLSQPSLYRRTHQPLAAEEPKDGDTANTDILNSPGFLKRKIDVLKSDITETNEKITAAEELLKANELEWKSQIEYLEKEYKTMQSRMNSQNVDDQAVCQVARQLLEVLDNFDRAFGVVVPSNDAEHEIAQLYEGVYGEILGKFKSLGIEEVPTVGTEFDYEIHQAVMQRANDEYEEGFVCEEYQKGFKIGDTLIRAAMVAVAA